MSDKEVDSKFTEFFIESANKMGIACSTVKDGHVLLFKREYLQKILDTNPDKESILIFVKRPDFKD